MAVKLVTTPAKHWTCDVCGKVDTWTDEWRWFSSFRIEENCGCKVVACSPECRKRAALLALRETHDVTPRAEQ